MKPRLSRTTRTGIAKRVVIGVSAASATGRAYSARIVRSVDTLRPLGVGEILDAAIKAYSRNARTLITIAAIVGIPFELLSGVIQLSTVSAADQVGSFGVSTGNMTGSISNARLAGIVLTALIGFLVTLVVTAATVKAVGDAYLGESPSVGDSLRFALRRTRSLLWLYLLAGVGLTLAFVCLVLPAVWLGVAWGVATPALLIEDVRGTKALRRSFRLVRRRWWPAFGVQLMAIVIVSVASFVVSGLLTAIPLAVDGSSVALRVIASTVSSAFAVALVQPVEGAITTILYFDLRVRKEGLDVALLASRLGFPETGAAAAGPGAIDAGGVDDTDPFGRARE